MRGSIRALFGFMIALGAVGTVEINPDANLLVQITLATLGLAIMATGVAAMNKEV